MNTALFDSVAVSQDQGERLIETLLSTEVPLSVGFINQHAFNLCQKHSDINRDFLALDVLLRDGIGIELAMKLFKLEPGSNLNGTDFIPKLVEQSKGCNVMAFGTQEPWLSQGVEALGVAEYCSTKLDGFVAIVQYIAQFEQAFDADKLNLVILAMGMPKQEQLARELKAVAKGKVVIVCGGAILDFASGRVERAPAWVRRANLEWAYRLFKEPKRLFNRYVIGIPVFFMHLAKLKLGSRSNTPPAQGAR